MAANDISTSYYDPTKDPKNQPLTDFGNIPGFGAGVQQGEANTAAANARGTAAQNVAGVALPQFSGDYQSAGMLNPAMYQDPTLAQAQTVNEAPEGRAAQLQALSQLGQRSDQSIASQQSLDRYNAMQNASQFAAGREGAIEQDAMRRGQAGSGAELMLRAQAGQSAANNLQQGGLQSAQMAALQRLAGSQAVGQLGGQMRGQDQSAAIANQNALNTFGLNNAAATTAIRNANTDLQNKAQAGNLANTQGILNARVERGDQNQMAGYGAALGRANSAGNLLTGQAAGIQAGPGLVNQANQSGYGALKDIAKGIAMAVG